MLYLQRRWAKVQCMEDQLENTCNSGEGLRCAIWIQRRSSLIGSSHQIIASDYIMSNCNTWHHHPDTITSHLHHISPPSHLTSITSKHLTTTSSHQRDILSRTTAGRLTQFLYNCTCMDQTQYSRVRTSPIAHCTVQSIDGHARSGFDGDIIIRLYSTIDIFSVVWVANYWRLVVILWSACLCFQGRNLIGPISLECSFRLVWIRNQSLSNPPSALNPAVGVIFLQHLCRRRWLEF